MFNAQKILVNRFNENQNEGLVCSRFTKWSGNDFFEIRSVCTAQERQDLMHLRYQIYVNEMARSEPRADHEKQILCEPLDLTAELIGVFHNNNLVGIGRLNFSRDSRFVHDDLFDIAKFEAVYPKKLMFISRLMIDPKLRKTSLFLDLCRFIFARAIEEGVEVGILNCNYNDLVRIFERIGFRQYKGTVKHPEYGVDTTPMAFYVNDVRYLKKIKSPLVNVQKVNKKNESFRGVNDEKIRYYFRELEKSL